MRDRINEMLLDHEKPEVIIKKLVLSITPRTLFRYKKALLTRAFESNLKTLKTIAVRSDNKAPSIQREAVLNQAIESVSAQRADLPKQRVREIIDRRLARRERWLQDAEQRKQADKDGNVIITMDHGALSRHDANDIRDTELLARVEGIMTDSTPDANRPTLVVFIPSMQVTGQSPRIAQGPVIDALPADK